MMMDHHRFIQPSKSSNVMIGGSGSKSAGSDTTDDLTASDPAAPDDFGSSLGDNHINSGVGHPSSDPTVQSSSIFGDDAFDKINMDFDSIMASDLDISDRSARHLAASKPSGITSSDTSVNSDMLFDKLYNSELGGGSELKGIIEVGNSPEGGNSKMGMSSKLGDIGDELDMELLEDLILPTGNSANEMGAKNGDNSVNKYQTSASTSVPVVSSGDSMGSLAVPGTARGFRGPAGVPNQQAQGFSPSPHGGGHSNNSASSIEKIMMGSSDTSIEKLINLPLIDVDNHNPRPTSGNNQAPAANSSSTNAKNNNSDAANTNLKSGVGSLGSLYDSSGSLPSLGIGGNSSLGIGSITPNASFSAAQNSQGMHAGHLASHTAANNNDLKNPGHQQAMLMQRQQQLFLQQQQQQQQLMRQRQQQQRNNNNQNPTAASTIQSIVNEQLSQITQANQMNKLGAAGLEQEKMKLIRRLQEIERSGGPMNAGQQQHQQQVFLRQQMLLQQRKQQQQQQQLGQQQHGMSTSSSSMPSLRPGGQIIQGQTQGQQHHQQQQANRAFAMNQQMMQQQGDMAQSLLSPTPIAVGPTSTPFSANNNMNMSTNNNSTTDRLRQQQFSSSMYANTAGNSNSGMNNNSGRKSNVSSVMESKGKETPLLSFLRNKRGPSNSNNTMMSAASQQQIPGSSNHSENSDVSGSILDAAPIDFSSSSTNPFLKQMMNNLDRSVGTTNMRGRQGRLAGRGLSSSVRRSMIQQMSSGGTISKNVKALQNKKPSSDFYQSAGIISRHASADHLMVPARRSGLTAGAAKAQNRRFSLNRSGHGSSGNLSKSRSRSKQDLTKGSSGGLTKSGSSSRSLCSNDSTGSLIPHRRTSRGNHGAKHRLSSTARRTHSVPANSSVRESAAAVQQWLEDNQDVGTTDADGWP